MHTYKQLTYILIFTLLFVGAVSVQAQTEVRTNTAQQTNVRTGVDIDDKCGPDEVCPEDTSELESDRCDGGVCPEQETQERCEDGICADTDADGREDVQARERCDDGVCTEVEEAEGASYNNSRSNRATVAPDGDLDGDGYGDVEMRERCEDGICTEAEDTENNINICDGVTCSDGSCAATASECSGLDEETRGLDQKFQQVATSVSPVRDTESDTDYNNNRSNRATVAGDGEEDRPEAAAERGTIKELDKSSPKLIQALRIAEDSPLMGEGVELYLEDEVCEANDEDCDDDGITDTVSPRTLSMRVSGETVRGWSPDQKAELARRLQVAGTSTAANDFGLRVAQAAVDNEDVDEIVSDEDVTEVRFRTQMRLLGFIPTRANATARADAGGEVEVDYPWYGFLASKGDSSIFRSLASELRAVHDVMVSVQNDPPQASDE